MCQNSTYEEFFYIPDNKKARVHGGNTIQELFSLPEYYRKSQNQAGRYRRVERATTIKQPLRGSSRRNRR